MGTDIHAVVQRLDTNTLVPALEGYRYLERPRAGMEVLWNLDRDYLVFGILAGVRCREVPPVAPDCRGIAPRLPLPAGTFIDEFIGDWGYHWLLLSELMAYPFQDLRVRYSESSPETRLGDTYLFAGLVPTLRKWADENGLSYDEVRLVFGFDS